MILKYFSYKQIFVMTTLTGLILLLGFGFFFTKNKEAAGVTSRIRACYEAKPNTENSTLELVHIVSRHGPRTPVDTYPNDPYAGDDFAPTGWGHVTNKGKRELYRIGKWLHARYGEFLAPYYKPDILHAQATASPRAMMSLQTLLAGMCPPQGNAMDWNSHLDWQPIPIFSEPLQNDSLLLVRTPCPRYFEALDETLHSPEVQAELAEYQSLFEELSNITGSNIRSAEDVNSLYITLLAEQEFGYKLPEWTQKYFPERMQYLAEQSYIYNAYTSEMQRIKGGPFLKKMLEEIKLKRENALRPSERKMFIYTGHDWTVGNILSALQVWQRQMPRFSIMALFETHRNKVTGEYYVEIFLRNDEFGCLRQLQVPNCELQCPLDKLIALSANVLPNGAYEQRCKAHRDNFIEPPPRQIDQM